MRFFGSSIGCGTSRKAFHATRNTYHASLPLRHPSRVTRHSQQGIALVIVMISIFVLAMLAAGFAISMKTETKLARNANSEVELQWLGRSGVEYCRWILAQQLAIRQEPYDALNQVWAGGAGGLGTSNSPLANVQSDVKLGNGHFTWKIVDLERKMNINLAPEPMLQQALIRMGTDASSVTPIVSSIQDWIDPDDTTHMEGAESSDYESLDPPYEAKNGPLDDISELLLIKGVTPDLYWGPNSTNHSQGYYENKLGSFGTPSMQGPLLQVGLVDLFTSLSTGKINVNTASSAVLQMIPGVEAQVADSIISARDGEDDGTGLTGPYRSVDQVRRVPGVSLELARQISQFCDVRSKTFEVTITAESGGYTRHFTAVLGRANAKDVQVLTFYWK